MQFGQDHMESIVIRFLQGTADPNEVGELKNWIDKDESNFISYHQMQDLWNSVEIDQKVTQDHLSGKWKEIVGKIGEMSAIPTYRTVKNSLILRLNFLKVAAVFVLGFIVAILWMEHLKSIGEIRYAEVRTPMGAKSEILLSDGTNVWLNAGSTLKYPVEFRSGEREVFLKGEAYFSVSKNKKKKFKVNTENFVVTAFGTEFNVKSYPEENTSETTLVEGSISVTRTNRKSGMANEEIFLEPNQRLVMYKKNHDQNMSAHTQQEMDTLGKQTENMTRLVISKGIETQEFVSWKDGTLNIRSETLEELAKKLERRYNVKFVFVNEEIKKISYSGMITNETLEQVLVAIQFASPIQYIIEEGVVTIKINSEYSSIN